MHQHKHFIRLASVLPSLASATACSKEALTSIVETIPDASLNFASWVQENGTFGDATPGIGNANASSLPELCGLSVNIQAPGNTSYNFGLFLPKKWNQRFMATGNGGFGGGVAWPEVGRYSHYGFATVSTDTGHISQADDASWGLNEPDKLFNWGYRAMHGSVVAAKQITEAYYADDILYSYYSSCSNGGRQGLKEIQLHPETFDGVLAGAPGWQPVQLSAWMVHVGLLNADDPRRPGARLQPTHFAAVVEEMVRQCDGQDGVTDGIISDPFGCNFDFNPLLCRGTPNEDAAKCLSIAQIETAERLYADYWETGQTLVHPAVSLGADITAVSMRLTGLGTGLYTYWTRNDTNWDTSTLSVHDIQEANSINPGQAAVRDFDPTGFQARGGKLLLYHGLSDMLIPARGSVQLYDKLYRALTPQGTDLASFMRLYLIPGMGHCFGGMVAPWYVGAGHQDLRGATHSVPGFEDAKHDVVLAMMDWVERGVAPGEIVATKFRGDDATGGGVVERQRPLCAYPGQARLVGEDADVDAAESWKCE